MTNPTLAPVAPDQYARVGELLSRAFHEDPLWAAVFPDRETRPTKLARMFGAFTKAISAGKGVTESTPGLEAVALWLPPGRNLGFVAMLRSGFALPRFGLTLPAAERKPMLAVLRQLDERSKALMPDPYWYLSTIGVEPAHQGKGLGSTLVRAGMARADADGVPIYLETETTGNVRYYEHLGFEVAEEITATGLDLPLWLMIRAPHPAGD